MVLRRRRRHQFVLKSAGPDRARDGAAARLGRHSRRDAQGDAAGGAQDRRGAGLEGDAREGEVSGMGDSLTATVGHLYLPPLVRHCAAVLCSSLLVVKNGC